MRLFILTVFLSLSAMVANAQTYYAGAVVPYSYPAPMPYSTPLVVAPPVTYIAPPPLVRYQWVPHYYNVPVITYRHRWFLRKERVVTYQPMMKWTYRAYYPNAVVTY